MRIVWIKASEFCLTSGDDKYTISRANVSGGIVYTAWRGKVALHMERCANDDAERRSAIKSLMAIVDEDAADA